MGVKIGFHKKLFVSIPKNMFVIFIRFEGICYSQVLGDPEVTANIYCKSRNLTDTDTQNYSTDLR